MAKDFVIRSSRLLLIAVVGSITIEAAAACHK